MAKIKRNSIELIKKLRSLNKAYFTVADLEKILRLERNSLYVTLNRLVNVGMLQRLSKNIYTLFTEEADLEKIALETYFPSYLSFEQALSQYGILSQIPYSLTFATLRHTKIKTIRNVAIEYSHLKKELFFGFIFKNNKYIAEKEKALLDQLYMVSLGRRSLDIEELDLKSIDRKKLDEYAKKFPARIKPLVGRVKKYIGTTPMTIKGENRIVWA